MSGRTVAIRYAKALYKAASEKNMIESIAEDISTIQEIITQAMPIRDYCLKSHANRGREMIFINTAFIPYVNQHTGEMLKIAVRNGRLAALPYLSEAFNKIINSESGDMEVILESAGETEKSLQKVIEKKMEMRLGQKVKLKNVVVPELLGGFRILWNNRMIDMSAAGRLKKMRTLIKTA